MTLNERCRQILEENRGKRNVDRRMKDSARMTYVELAPTSRPNKQDLKKARIAYWAALSHFADFATKWVKENNDPEIPGMEVCREEDWPRFITPAYEGITYREVEPQHLNVLHHRHFCQYLRAQGMIAFLDLDDETKVIWIKARVDDFNETTNLRSDSVAEEFAGA